MPSSLINNYCHPIIIINFHCIHIGTSTEGMPRTINITYRINVPEEVNCTVNHGEHVAKFTSLCLLNANGTYTPTRDLPSDIIVIDSNCTTCTRMRGSTGLDGSTRSNLSVLITNHERGDVSLQCCYSNETDTIIVGETYLFIQVSNENKLEGKILIIKFSVHFDLTT